MAAVLGVDIEVLSKTVQSLETAEQVLFDEMKAMSEDSHADIGTKELNDAANSFQTRWRYGIERNPVPGAVSDVAGRVEG